MQKIIDSNFLRSEGLREYLSKSPHNYAVLTDYAAMEAYKGDILVTIYNSTEILSRYPQQVIVLRPTLIVCGLSGRAAGLRRRMIDHGQTRGFQKYCQHLVAAERGNLDLREQLLQKGRDAIAHFDRMVAGVANLPNVFGEVAKVYTEAEIRILRKGSGYTEEMIDKLVRVVLHLAATLFADHPRVNKLPSAADLPNTFIFRVALCGHILMLRWIALGGERKIKPEKLRNDMVDINFAAFATYFDGLLSSDEKLNTIYREAVLLLRSVFSASKAQLYVQRG
jgi:hypothetical protein